MKEENINNRELKITETKSNSELSCQVIQPNSFINGDCMEFMRTCPPNFFDLAIVDPPYGIGIDDWDIKPEQAYFDELFRISKKQIIWGGNYFNLPATQGWLCWDKTFSDDMAGKKLTQGGVPRENMADFELAWTSFLTKPKFIRYTYIGNLCGFNDKLRVDYTQEKKIHKTQKPTAIYKWLVDKYACSGDKILDTHVGSASSLIVYKEMGFEYWGWELNPEIYTMAKSRLGRATRKYELFEAV